jgi:hypothetical protein
MLTAKSCARILDEARVRLIEFDRCLKISASKNTPRAPERLPCTTINCRWKSRLGGQPQTDRAIRIKRTSAASCGNFLPPPDWKPHRCETASDHGAFFGRSLFGHPQTTRGENVRARLPVINSDSGRTIPILLPPARFWLFEHLGLTWDDYSAVDELDERGPLTTRGRSESVASYRDQLGALRCQREGTPGEKTRKAAYNAPALCRMV